MSFVYEELQLWLTIPKCIQAVISMLTAVIVYRKSKYLLNKAFFVAFLAWSLVAVADSVMYLIAANGEIELFLGNILRDVALVLSNITCFAMLFAVIIVTRGKEEATSRKTVTLLVAAFLFIVIGTGIFDYLAVVDTATGLEIPPASLPPATGITFKVTAPTNPPAAVFFLASLLLFLVSIILLARVLGRIKDPAQKRRIILFIVGLVLIFGGYAWFLIIVALKFQVLLNYVIGYIIWSFAPICTLKGVLAPESDGDTSKNKEK